MLQIIHHILSIRATPYMVLQYSVHSVWDIFPDSMTVGQPNETKNYNSAMLPLVDATKDATKHVKELD